MRYTITHFNRDFPDEDACLEYIFNLRYGKDYECPKCHLKGFYHVPGRKSYACKWYGHQISPLAGTIFHKSPTNLRNWFFAIFLMMQSRNGVAAKEIQRQVGVTYKCAWRMVRQIRKLLKEDGSIKLGGEVEIDDTYIGGKHHGKPGRGAQGKSIVFGMVEREGELKADVVEDLKAKTVMPLIQENVEEKSHIMSDEFPSYERLVKYGFDHDVIKHRIKEYVRGNVHTNTIEGFWSQLKRSIDGTYHSVSSQHLQLYVDEFAYRYNHRVSEIALFELVLQRAVAMPDVELQRNVP